MRSGKWFKISILTGGLTIALALGAVYYFLHTYTVRNVYVEGNVHYTEEEIKEIVMAGPLGHNSLFLSLKYKNKGIQGIPFVDVMDVSILSPDTIRVTVYEKALIGYVKYLDAYMYFDKDGYVVESSSLSTAGVPQVSGLTFDHMVVGEALPVDNPEVFSAILNVTKLLEKYELDADNIYFHRSGDVTLYFGQVKVALGNDGASLEDKLMLLPELLGSLEGKAGTLQMQSAAGSGGRYTFQPEG